jgi:hypothetical protein
LKKAISDGDTRAIALLDWAGVSSFVDEDTIIWALNNAGGNKLGVLNHLFLSTKNNRTLGRVKVPKVPYELERLKEEARKAAEQERFDLVEAIARSRYFDDFVSDWTRCRLLGIVD